MDMEALIQRFTAATAPGPGRATPGAVIAAVTATGETFMRVFGTTTAHEDAPALQVNSVMWLASVTKILTTVAALQCVEKGHFGLDDPVSDVLPVWSHPDILSGFDPSTGQPVLRKATRPITLRHLLTHTSGMALEQAHPLLSRWRAWKDGGALGGDGLATVGEGGSMLDLMKAGFAETTNEWEVPLVYEPGEGWSYAGGLDVAARMIEQVTGFSRFEDYMAEYICKPLNMRSTTFHPAQRPELTVAPITVKLPNNHLKSDVPLPFPNQDPRKDGGGSGLFSTAEDFIKLLASLLLNDGRLLRPETRNSMFEPQLSSNKYLMENLAIPEFAKYMTPGMPAEREWNWGLGGILAMNGILDRAADGFMGWCGIANAQWWIDPEAGTCGILLTHLIPPGDGQTSKLFGEFQSTMFSHATT